MKLIKNAILAMLLGMIVTPLAMANSDLHLVDELNVKGVVLNDNVIVLIVNSETTLNEACSIVQGDYEQVVVRQLDSDVVLRGDC